MDWSHKLNIWMNSSIKLLDVRRMEAAVGNAEFAYPLPANAFLFVAYGEAAIRLHVHAEAAPADNMLRAQEKLRAELTDDRHAQAELEHAWYDGKARLLHGAKGATLSFRAQKEDCGYYLLLYKPLGSLLDSTAASVFSSCYSFQVPDSAAITVLLEKLYDKWQAGDPFARLEANGLFLQVVAEQFRQMHIAAEQSPLPELAVRILQYIEQRSNQPFTMEELAAHFHYSAQHLVRVFRKRYGISPNEYATRERINRACKLLLNSDFSIAHIAESIGYNDMYYFNRLFKKLTGKTPAQYKRLALGVKGSIYTKKKSQYFIAPVLPNRYIDNKDNHYQLNHWSEEEMKTSLKPSSAAALLLSFALLLSACMGANNTANIVETRIYTDALQREVEIPVTPQRAVVVTYGGYLLPLGIKPVGVDQWVLDLYGDEMKDVASIGADTGSVEVIADLNPDIIILPDYHSEETYASYEQIAPTVAVAWGGDPDVINTIRDMGDIMNKKEEAEQWVAKFEQKLDYIREQLSIKLEPGTTALTFILHNGELLIGGKGGTLGKLIYEDFGFELPEQFQQYADGGAGLSMEALVDKPADYFFTQMRDEEYAAMLELFEEPLYQSVPAIAEQRITNVSRDYWNFGPYLVEQGVDVLIEEMSKQN